MSEKLKILIAIILTAVITLMLIRSHKQAYDEGIKHAVEDSLVYCQYDQIIIELDGELYTHDM